MKLSNYPPGYSGYSNEWEETCMALAEKDLDIMSEDEMIEILTREDVDFDPGDIHDMYTKTLNIVFLEKYYGTYEDL